MIRRCAIIASLILFSAIQFSAKHIIHPGVGEKAPEIALPDPEDSIRKLSSHQGKLVLVQFWASWCKTCRVENRDFTKLYKEFKDSSFRDGQGFEIFSVSLDINKNQWTNAIKNDKLVWSGHVSDLKKWESSVVDDYNFKYLPHNLLIDSTGKVVAKELYGERLRLFLESRTIR
jgi:thiol-disulfide isomerase/thioredoxin